MQDMYYKCIYVCIYILHIRQCQSVGWLLLSQVHVQDSSLVRIHTVLINIILGQEANLQTQVICQ